MTPSIGEASAQPTAAVISAVYLTGSTLMLPLPTRQVQDLVADACSALEPESRPSLDTAADTNEHWPVLIDIWQLKDGRLELAGLTQHEWSELAYGTVGGALGAAVGALGGATQGLMEGLSRGRRVRRASRSQLAGFLPMWQRALESSLQGGLSGISRGVTALGRVGRTLSQNSARALGNYVEVMFSVPDVRIASPGAGPTVEPFALSLGVYTDSKPACAIDKNFRYGLGKTLATIEFGRNGETELTRVIDLEGREVLSASLRSLERLEQPPQPLARWLEAPLLGIHRGNGAPATLRRSWLHRHFASGVVRALDGAVRLPFGPFGLPSGDWLLAGSRLPLAPCIGYERVWSEITLPDVP